MTSSAAAWQPLSARVGDKPFDDTLYEGVPDHLVDPLQNWLEDAIATDRLAERVNLRLRRPAGRPIRTELVYGGRSEMLDIIDAILHIRRDNDSIRLRDELADLLEDGGSAYKISEDLFSLERRVDPSVTEAFQAAQANAAKAGRKDAAAHLAEAWKNAYGLNPDPGVAYREAVKAAEAAAIPVVIPSDPVPTLGKVLSSLGQGAAKWELAIADKSGAPAPIDPAIAMIALLWEGHRDRHAGGPTTAPITQPAAEAAVHLAATLVQWFSSGAVRRKSGP